MEENIYKVYIKTNENNIVTAVNSSAFISDLTGWVKVDEGTGDKYHHAQGNYLPKGLTTDDGVYRYEYINKKIQERSEEAIQADRESQMVNQPLTLAEQSDILTALLQGV